MNGLRTLRRLLSADNSGAGPGDDEADAEHEHEQDYGSRRARKKAAFDAWHRRKLGQLASSSSDATLSTAAVQEEEGEKEGDQRAALAKRPSSSRSAGDDEASASTAEAVDEQPPSRKNSKSSAAATVALMRANAAVMANKFTAPKLSRHNDTAYYPNIQCILCQEWVCSRNRYMHIESHLQYRPYRCSVCGYDNRKEIFVSLHIKRSHAPGAARVNYEPDAQLERKAWKLAEQCLQHTRQILSQNSEQQQQCASDSTPRPTTAGGEDKSSTNGGDEGREVQQEKTKKSEVKAAEQVVAEYASIFRPRIFNSQRAEKSLLIEESRQLGLVPDLSEISNREAECGRCSSHVLAHPNVLEEHVRCHLSRPSYRCNIDRCATEHHSKNFLNRHMKEVHKYRRPPLDLLTTQADLTGEFAELCRSCFPEHFSSSASLCRRRTSAPVTAATTPAASSTTAPVDPTKTTTKSAAKLERPTRLSLAKTENERKASSAFSALQRELLKPIRQTVSLPPANLQPPPPTLLATSPLAQALMFAAAAAAVNAAHSNTAAVAGHDKNSKVQANKTEAGEGQQCCQLCQQRLEAASAGTSSADYQRLYEHVKSHLSVRPFYCAVCGDGSLSREAVFDHCRAAHSAATLSQSLVRSRMDGRLAQQTCLLVAVCFPAVTPRLELHDPVGLT